MSDTQSPKLNSIQLLRGAAALLVLLHHLSLRFEQRLFDSNWLIMFEHIGFAGVDLFFVISGTIMMITCHRHLGDRSQMAPFLWRRATRIYPLYWLFTLLQLAALLMVPTASERAVTAGHVWKSLLLWPQSVYPLLAPGWTLVYELYFYLMFACLFVLPRAAMRWFLFAWGVFTVAAYWQLGIDGQDTTDGLTLPLWASPLCLEFLLGCWIGNLYVSSRSRIQPDQTVSPAARNNRWPLTGKPVLLLAGIAWLIAGWWLIERAGAWFAGGSDEGVWSAEFGLTRVATFGVAAATITHGLLGGTIDEPSGIRCTIGSGTATRLAVWLGNLSYSLYLSHLLVMNAMLIACQRLLATSGFETQNPAPGQPTLLNAGLQWATLSLAIVVCVAVAAASYRWIERPLLRRFRSK